MTGFNITAVIQGLVLVLGIGLGGVMGVILVNMALSREVSALEVGLWLVAYLGLLMTTIVSVGAVFFWFSAALTVALGIAPPVMGWLGDRVGSRLMQSRDLMKLLEASQRHPEIPDYYRRIADVYYGRGQWAEAVDYYERAYKLSRDPEAAFYLRKARERLDVGDKNPVQCPACGRLNPRSRTRCYQCNEPLPMLELGVLVGHSRARVVLLYGALAALAGGAIHHRLRPEGVAGSLLLLVLGLLLAFAYFHVVRVVQPARRR